MLDSLGTKIDSVHEHVSNMNEKLKETIEKVFMLLYVCMYVCNVYVPTSFGDVKCMYVCMRA